MDIWEKITALQRDGVAAVVITITAVRGSVPGQVGAKAIVTADGLHAGNLGGGKIEAAAIARASAMLAGPEFCETLTWNLQRDVGMTCGGEMGFLFEKVTAAPPWHIVVFGAGHISQALVPVLARLACRIEVIDTRSDWLEKLPSSPNVTRHLFATFEAGVAQVACGSFVLAITRGHSSDRPVLRDVLTRFPDIAFLGVIGSASKRAVLIRELKEDGVPAESLDQITCPLGLPLGTNDPAEIAISIAAQLLQCRK